MRAVDTNVLVRLVARDDAKQAATADAFVEKGTWISHLVLVETVWALATVYRLRRGEIATAVEMILKHQHLAIEDPDTVARALEVYRKKARLGFSDCLVLEVARSAGHLPLGTFDRALGKLDGAERL